MGPYLSSVVPWQSRVSTLCRYWVDTGAHWADSSFGTLYWTYLPARKDLIYDPNNTMTSFNSKHTYLLYSRMQGETGWIVIWRSVHKKSFCQAELRIIIYMTRSCRWLPGKCRWHLARVGDTREGKQVMWIVLYSTIHTAQYINRFSTYALNWEDKNTFEAGLFLIWIKIT